MPESLDDKLRMSGPRGDFVASLGRRLQTLREALKALEQEPGDDGRRNALLRRVHALGASARVLGFASVAEALAGAEHAIARGQRVVPAAELAEVSRVLDVIPSLVGGAPLSLRPPRVLSELPEALRGRQWPLSLLLFGGAALEEKLTHAVQRDSVEFERAEDVERAAQIARVLGPDLLLVDADAPRAIEFFERVLRDDLTEPVSSIFLGDFKHPAAPQRLTVLGASRVLNEPVSPDTLRRTIEELCQSPLSAGDAQKPFGQLTVEGLAARLAEEMERGLVQAVQAGTQATRVDFGDGTDVMAAVWGTVTRVRELITARSQGAVRFDPIGPEGAIALTAWGERERRAGERGARGSRDESQVSLSGRRVVVVDDDPAVTWFLSGLLKAVGAEVLEAYDGAEALVLAQRHWPDLIVSDVLMPKLDGFSLCREIKRDVAVRDTPVILLSWKEDLLQRMRELGAEADGYLRKEAAASTVVQRIREVMRPRARVEARLRQGGEVRGRLDGLTPRLVLELCCKSRQDLRLEVRDAFFRYLLQIRRGRLMHAERERAGGERQEGKVALRSLLGVSAGRFLIVPDKAVVKPQFQGDLFAVLMPFVESARSWQQAFSTLPLTSLNRIDFDQDELDVYSRLAPAPVKGLIEKLAAGIGPKALLLDGASAPDLLLNTLSDLARRGVVTEVLGADGPWAISQRAEAAVVRDGEFSRAGGAAAPAASAAPAGQYDGLALGKPEATALSEPESNAKAAGDEDGSVEEAQAAGSFVPEDQTSAADSTSQVTSEAPSVEASQPLGTSTANSGPEAVPGPECIQVALSSPQAASTAGALRRAGASVPQPSPASDVAASGTREKLAPVRMVPLAEETMDSLDPKQANTEGAVKAAFSFQLSPEPPAAEVSSERKLRSHLPAARPLADASDLDDAGWFGSTLESEPPLALSTASAVGSPAALSDAATRTPPPAAVAPAEAPPELADPLADTAISTAAPKIVLGTGPAPARDAAESEAGGEQPATPASGQQIALLLSDESGEPPLARPAKSGLPEAQAAPLPATKPIEFPSRKARQAATAAEPAVANAATETGRAGPSPDAPLPLESVPPSAGAQPLAPPAAELPQVREQRTQEDTPATFEQSATPAPGHASPTPKGMRAAPAARDTTSTLKVIGYALVAMVFSYLGMSAVVSWFAEPASDSELAMQAAPLGDETRNHETAGKSPASSAPQAVPLGKAVPNTAKPPSKPEKPSAKAAKFVATDMPMPAGLAIGKDKGVLKIVTPDAHTIYVDGEFAGRGPVRIVPLPPGRHDVKTRYEGEEQSFSADVKAGRMTRLSLAAPE